MFCARNFAQEVLGRQKLNKLFGIATGLTCLALGVGAYGGVRS